MSRWIREHLYRHPHLRVDPLEDRVVPSVSVVLDINTFSELNGSNPGDYVQVGGLTYFCADTPNHGRELWRTDGSSTGTTLVKDIRPGWYGSDLSDLVNVSGLLYFTANDGVNGYELWRSNGTSSGTVLVDDIQVGAGDSFPRELTNFGDNLYFSANDGVSGYELWRTTAGVPSRLADLEPGPGDSDPLELTPVGANLFFRATTTSEGSELWSTTNVGTPVLVENIGAGAVSGDPRYLTNVSGVLYFSARVAGHELWRSTSPDAAGTSLVEDFPPLGIGSYPAQLTNGGGVLYFSAFSNEGRELYRSQGTPATTFLIADINPGAGGSGPEELTMVGTTLYFSAFNGSDTLLWKSDGTSSGTVLVENNSPSPDNLTNVGGVLYFSANDPTGGDGLELWKSEGTDANTFILEDINPGPSSSFPGFLTNIGGVLYFRADNGIAGLELWRSTAPGFTATDLVRDIDTSNASGLQNGLYPNLVNADGVLYFAADNGTLGRELWRSSGTGLTTGQVGNIAAGVADSDPDHQFFHNGFLYFSAFTGASGYELWRSDGTGPGTTLVRDINPGIGDSDPAGFMAFNGGLYFSATSAAGGRELWRTDGTFGGTLLVRDINPGAADSHPSTLINLGGTLLFRADDGTHGEELWRSNGTSSGTTMVRDINPLAADSFPFAFTVLGGVLYFYANDTTNGYENYWRSNGTYTGTMLVRDINPGPGDSAGFNYVTLGDRIYLSANDGVHGNELWRSDGTSSGTVLVEDIRPGSASGSVSGLTTDGRRLYFRADDGTYGAELWIHEPSTATTYLAADIKPGSGGAGPTFLTNVNGTLYFFANDGVNGRELWRASDGDVVLAEQVVAGSGDGLPRDLIEAGGVLYFVAFSPTAGRELHRLDGGLPPHITSNGAEKAAAVDFIENSTALVTTVTSSDPNGGPITYSISGVDAADFTINSSTGALSFAATPNFEAPQDSDGDNVYRFVVRASDGLLFDDQTFLVTVLDRLHDQPTVYVDAAWVGLADGTVIADADPFTAGNQVARIGTEAHATLERGIDAVNGTLVMFAGTYADAATLAVPFSLRVPTGTVTISGVLNGAFAPFKTGFGTLSLTAANTFTGTSVVDRGVLSVAADSAFGAAANSVEVRNLGTLNFADSTTTSRTFDLPGGTLNVSIGKVLTFSNAFIGGGFLDGLGTIRTSNSGFVLFSGCETSGSLTLVLQGSTALEQFTNNGVIATAVGKSVFWTDVVNNPSGRITINGVETASSFSTLGQIAINGNLANTGSPGLTFGGGSLTTINPGGSIDTGAAGALVSNGYVLNKGSFGNAAGTITIDFGGKVEGNAVFGSLVTKNGGIFSPGSSPGPASTHKLNINGGGTLEFEITNASGSPATLSGWDMVTVGPTVFSASPVIDFTATPASKYNILLSGREDNGDFNTPGKISNFNSALSYAWKFADGAVASQTGVFDAKAFAIDTSGFSNPFTGGFSVELRDAGKNLYVVYTPVAGPVVTSIVVNNGAVQRSRITSIQVNFANPVDASTLTGVGAITLTRTAATPTGTIGTVVDTSNGLIVTPASGMVSSITLTFANVLNAGVEHASLADGRWQLAIPSASYTSPLNDPTLRRLFGDVDANGTVDGTDFGGFGTAFGQTLPDSPFDFDNNGTLDGTDFGAFGGRFGLTI